jgi:Cyclic nucleotide-binding domain
MSPDVDLRRVSLLQSLSDQQLRTLASLGQTTELQAGQVVFEEGDAATRLYVIMAGRVRVVKAGRATWFSWRANTQWMVAFRASTDGIQSFQFNRRRPPSARLCELSKL